MFKFDTIGAFKQVRNNPRSKAVIQLQNGMVVIPNDATNLAPTAANAVAAQGDVYVANNIMDKPEIRNTVDFVIEAGEYVRAFRLADLVGLPVSVDYRVVKDTYASLAVGDVLVPCNDTDDAADKGKWKKDSTTASAYNVNLKIIEKTSFGDKGLRCTVVVN